jgi:CHAT domain-containing protein
MARFVRIGAMGLDESLQSIPLSLLHDGKSYLNEYFSIANSMGAKSLKRMSSNKAGNVLIGALSKTSPSFRELNAPKNLQPLPQVLREIDEIKKYSNIDQLILDEKFTVKDFQNAITRSKFSTIHLTTHGQFSSDPKKTVLLAWDRVINVTEIDQLLKSSLENYSFLDLLVLSACQTAKGDSKSALGIAGIATQAGARSVVASLWQPDAEASILFMQEFYKSLHDNKTKVESLRLAQNLLRNNTKYSHPYYWAPYILLGDWS